MAGNGKKYKQLTKNKQNEFLAMGVNVDLLGNEIKTGDVMLEIGRGFSCLNGGGYKYSLKLWEMPENFEGHAYYYTIDGSKHLFSWADVGSAIKVDMELMPEGFDFSFKHGMSDFSSKLENGTLQELIEHSNWKEHEIKKEQVEHFEFMQTLKIETIDDIKNNILELKKSGYVPHEIVSSVLKIIGLDRTPAHNGEIGFAGMYDYLHYQLIIEALIKDPYCFGVIEKTNKMNWISTKNELPEEGKYVLARHNRGNWNDSTDQDNVNCVVVKMKKGISLKERKKLDPKSERARTYRSEDEHGNNLVPYCFVTFGRDSFFGQSITHWMPIEPLK